MFIFVPLNERVLVHKNGQPERYLGPGRHYLFRPFAKVDLVRLFPDQLVTELRPDELAVVPPGELSLVEVGLAQRAVIEKHGRPQRWLGPGEHQVWTAEKKKTTSALGMEEQVPLVSVRVFDTSAVGADPLPELLRALAPPEDYAEITAPEGSVALRYVDGVLDAVLPPGRHAAWTTTRKVHFAVIDLRERLLHVTGQEVMTKDKLTLRLNVSANFKVSDAQRLATIARDPDEVLYLALQLALREAVATKTLDELLTGREALAQALLPAVKERAASLGMTLAELGVKDLVLPGEMKTLLNRVIEAQKEAEANVILRREEIAAVRSMAQTAKVMQENPLLLRLKELEAYKDLATKVGQVHLILGEGVVPKLDLSRP